MDQIFGDLPYCFVYVDDILVFSKDLTSHVLHPRDVFLLCCEYGLTIGLPKCQFAVEEIEFLGHRLAASGCSPLVKHSFKSIQCAQCLSSVTGHSNWFFC